MKIMIRHFAKVDTCHLKATRLIFSGYYKLFLNEKRKKEFLKLLLSSLHSWLSQSFIYPYARVAAEELYRRLLSTPPWIRR